MGNGFTPLYMRTTVTKLIARINDRIEAKKAAPEQLLRYCSLK
ncbi:uncharacterized protein METZ01_LOCUS200075 [marine metagenome]|uniref:Uncharacterized protein n=1 Tax=marine metagenome TaxID=408172 RepID=A0A382EB75_9ZZZZ